jgi:RNA ligase
MSIYGPTYPKINTLWKRDDRNRILVGDFARDEFRELAYDAMFCWTEKLDGTNTRFYWNGEYVTVGGRTDNANWSTPVLSTLIDIANQPGVFQSIFGSKHVVLYGEAFGPGIQKGGGYGDSVMFRPFDLRLGTEDGITSNSPFTGRSKLAEIAHALGVEPVEILEYGTILTAWNLLLYRSFKSTYLHHELEGIVGRPMTPFYVAKGEALTPVMVKMKYKDLDDLGR